ncbi:cyclic nucleotide-binding domain-containing protein [Chloroflexota bacterium]
MSHEEGLFGKAYEAGAVIFRQGEPGDTLYLIQAGSVEYSYKQGDAETVLTVLEKGDFFGEMALFGQDRRPATAKTTRHTRLLPLTRDALLERVKHDPGVALHLLRGLYLRIQHADRQVQQAVENNEVLRLALANREGEAAVPSLDLAAHALAEHAEAPADITIRELAALWDVERESIWFEPGQSIYDQGDPGEAMYIVLDGRVEIGSGSGPDRYVLFRLNPGDFFGEAEIITDRPRTATATAVSRTRLMRIDRDQFFERIKGRPELAVLILQALSVRLQSIGAILANPRASVEAVRQNWRPLLKKQERVKVAMVSLSTCAGCSAVFLDQKVLEQVLEVAEIVYCPMLMDQDRLPEADVALIDGAVRLKEDEEKLEEARLKSRFVVAWGTCAAFGGIPAHANRYELEDLIQETYGQTSDAYAYYLSGTGGVERTTYQEEGIALLRKAYELDDFVRVEYYVPGCPPLPGLLLQFLGELTGQSFQGAKPIVCAECGRRPTKDAVTSLQAFPRGADEATCFHSLGVLCTGLMTKGGCDAVCTRHGLPCWGCRGPAKTALKQMAGGDSFEEVVIEKLVRRCRLEEAELRPAVKLLRR